MLVELLWVTPWYQLLINPPGSVLSTTFTPDTARRVVILGSVMLIAYLVAHLAQAFQVQVIVERIVNLVVLALVLTVGLRSLLPVNEWMVEDKIVIGFYLSVLVLVWIWWRGAQLGQDIIHPRMARQRVVWGMTLLLLEILIAARTGSRPPGVFLFSVYVFLGLLALLFARIGYVGLAQGVDKNPFDRRWLLSSILSIGVLVLLALLVGSLMIGQPQFFIDVLGRVFLVVSIFFWFIVLLPFILVLYILETYFSAVMNFFRRLITNINWVLPEQSPLLDPTVIQQEPGGLVLQLASETKWVIVWVVVVLVILVIVFMRQRQGRGWGSGVIEQREALPTVSGGLRQLRQGFSDLVGRFRPQQKTAPSSQVRVRQIYIQLMEVCEKLGDARPPAYTPLEFLPDMGNIFNGFHEDLQLITLAYQRVRYGELPEETLDRLQAVEEAWQRLEIEGKRLFAQKIALEEEDDSHWERILR